MIAFRLKHKSLLEILAWINYNGSSGIIQIQNRVVYAIKGNFWIPNQSQSDSIKLLLEIQQNCSNSDRIKFTREENSSKIDEVKTDKSTVICGEELILQINRKTPETPQEFTTHFKQNWTIAKKIRTQAILTQAEQKIRRNANGKYSVKQISKKIGLSERETIKLAYGLYLIGEINLVPLKEVILNNSNSGNISLDYSLINKLNLDKNKRSNNKKIILSWLFLNILGLLSLKMGIFKFGELKILDSWQNLLYTRKSSPITVLEISETDIQQLNTYPISDTKLADTITNLLQHQPLAIGIDLYRDLPVPPGTSKLQDVLTSSDNIIGVFKHQEPVVNPQPDLEANYQIGFSDLINDRDRIVRRAILSLEKEDRISLGLATRLSPYYFLHKNYSFDQDEKGYFSLNGRTLVPITSNSGLYWNQDDVGGYQILIKYRPKEEFNTISLTQVLNKDFDPDSIEDRIILIGVTAASVNDRVYTPIWNQEKIGVSGVYAHANILQTLIDFADSGKYLRPITKQFEIVYALGVIFLLIACYEIIKKINYQWNIDIVPRYLIMAICCLSIASIIGVSGTSIYYTGLYLPIISTIYFGLINLTCLYFYKSNKLYDKLFASDYPQIKNRLYLELFWEAHNYSGNWREEETSLILCEIQPKLSSQLLKKVEEIVGQEIIITQIAKKRIGILLPKTKETKAHSLASQIAKAIPEAKYSVSSLVCPGDLKLLINNVENLIL